MFLTKTYLIAQVITVVYYGFLCASFWLKDRRQILGANLLAHIGQALAMFLLGGLSGSAMAGIMTARDLAFYFNTKKKLSDSAIFIATLLAIIFFMAQTYAGPLSLLSIAATTLATYAVYQPNVRLYKLLGFVGALLWLAYNVYIGSIAGIIFESILLIFSITGYFRDKTKASVVAE